MAKAVGQGGQRPGLRRDRRLKERAALLDLLKRVQYFRSLSLRELRKLAKDCEPAILPREARLFSEGDPCRGLFIITDGRVELRQTSLRGREQVLHSEGPGATLGEAPLFDRGGYIASAVAIEPTRVLFVPRAALIALCHHRPAVALAIAEALARRVRRFAAMAGDLAFRPVTERLARYIEANAAPVGQSVRAGSSLDLRLTQEQLAARLGTVRELVARALAQLEESGIIGRSRSQITIRDPARLAALSRGSPEVLPGKSHSV